MTLGFKAARPPPMLEALKIQHEQGTNLALLTNDAMEW